MLRTRDLRATQISRPGIVGRRLRDRGFRAPSVAECPSYSDRNPSEVTLALSMPICRGLESPRYCRLRLAPAAWRGDWANEGKVSASVLASRWSDRSLP